MTDHHDLLLQQGEGNTDVLQAILEKLNETIACVRKLEEQVAAINSGFPAGDPESHRRYHETIIEDLAERRRLRQAIQEKTISGLIWAALVGLGATVWYGILARLGLK